MYCIKKLTDDLYWVGGSDRRLALFENVFPIPRGVSYNSYLLMDEKTVLFDTVDKAVSGLFLKTWHLSSKTGSLTIWWLTIWSLTIAVQCASLF